VAPDQSSHLDALIGGIVVLLNMMPQGYAYVGVHLNSGGCIHALKNLIRKDYKEFCQQFGTAMTDDGRRLQDAMKGQSYQDKLDMAWELYAVEKLAEGGFTEKFQRVYFELEEFEMFLGSMAVFHFGARYPCFCGQEPIPLDVTKFKLTPIVARPRPGLARETIAAPLLRRLRPTGPVEGTVGCPSVLCRMNCNCDSIL